jgi:hypothetical protein
MRPLHIKALSGPRPITAEAVRVLLADGRVGPRSDVLSLDNGRSWLAVEDALAVIDRLAVSDADIDAALANGSLHPIAMPLGGVAVALLVIGIGFGGGPTSAIIRETPQVAAQVSGGVAIAGAHAVTSSADAVQRFACNSWSACLTAGALPAGMPRMDIGSAVDLPVAGKPDEPPPPAMPAIEAKSLQSAWRSLAADHASDAGTWTATAEQLAQQTRTAGIDAWTVSLTQVDKQISDSVAKEFPKADKPLRFAMFDPAKDAAPGSMAIMVVFEDKSLVKILDAAAKEPRDLRLSADVFKAQSTESDRSVVLMGYAKALE